MRKFHLLQKGRPNSGSAPNARRVLVGLAFAIMATVGAGGFWFFSSSESGVRSDQSDNQRKEVAIAADPPSSPGRLTRESPATAGSWTASAASVASAAPDAMPPRSDMSADASAPVHTPLTREPAGVEALAHVDGSPRALRPDQLGFFPRQPIGLGQTVSVRVRFPGGAEGDLVVVQSDDGGLVDQRSVVTRKTLDARGEMEFLFTSTLEGGVYRVTLRNGFDEKRLEFWGGPEPGGAISSTMP